jgi:hypothetical protein
VAVEILMANGLHLDGKKRMILKQFLIISKDLERPQKLLYGGEVWVELQL